MNNIVRAWKDEVYRRSLSTEERAMLPINPAGEMELTDTMLEAVYGACERADIMITEGHQNIDQKAAATFVDRSIIIDSIVHCSATAEVQDRNVL